MGGLNAIGWKTEPPKATFYVWTRVIKRHTSAGLAGELLEKADLVVTPGNGFGTAGEGYIRMALTVNEARLKEAVGRIERIL